MAEKMGKSWEKGSQFSVTCSLLSQYLKEKGSFGSIGLDIASPALDLHQPKDKHRNPTTLSLMPGVDVPPEGDDATDHQTAPISREDSVKTPPVIKEVEKSQLTIFYGGKVLVFDDFPGDKVRDLMQMAANEIAAAKNLSFPAPSPTSILASASNWREPPPPPPGLPSPAEANASDMPIARRNSLHRFLEKRKDRISSKAPYQAHGAPAASATDAELRLGREAPSQEHSSGSSR
ncbi:hypothetical protein OPV22_010928 [Ensete ventricosum]|uniref:Protein TIFY n=1 Tax=Ensete ventricosum TaxID=4639 RepID=A0AAV8RIG4_ENSVE|nr:hypothetical protein OPV22_010928 [Ensete ventricosum]